MNCLEFLRSGLILSQEYYVTHKDGYTIDSEGEKRRLTKCLIAAAERRVSHVSYSNQLS